MIKLRHNVINRKRNQCTPLPSRKIQVTKHDKMRGRLKDDIKTYSKCVNVEIAAL